MSPAVLTVLMIAVVFILASLLYPYPGCVHFPEYKIESTRSSIPPEKYVVLVDYDLGKYPVIGSVIDAFDEPNGYTSFLEGNNLTYNYSDWKSDGEILEMIKYLELRFYLEHGHPPPYPFYFSYAKNGEISYYSWKAVLVGEGGFC